MLPSIRHIARGAFKSRARYGAFAVSRVPVRGALALALLLSLTGCEVVPAQDGGATTAAPLAAGGTRAPFAIPAEATIPDGPLGDAVRRGRAILTATPESLPGHVGNDLRCTSCHLDAGTRENVMSWVGVYARFPQYRPRSGLVIDLEERIGDCFERSLNGRSPAYDSPEMRDMIAYMSWLSRDIPVGREVAGQGMPRLDPLPPDTAAGRAGYRATCARCHGEDGQGLVDPAPPLWGPRSYNIGAGMARLRTLAAFLSAAMPHDEPGTLTPQQSYDIAAYVNSHSRPDFAAKAKDWPNGDPPPDVAYRTDGRR
jgi:thiosulfate dehydrogenase